MAGADGLRRVAAGMVACAVLCLVLAPLAMLVRTLADQLGAEGWAGVSADELGAALTHTVALAAAVTAVAVPVGTLLALTLRRTDLPLRGVLTFAVLLPVLVPDFVLGFSWLVCYGRGGLLDQALGVYWTGLQGPVGVAVVLAVNAVPVASVVVGVGLAARTEPSMQRAARASGARPATVLRTVTLPLLRPALAAASVLVFSLTLGAFAVPEVLGAPSGFRTVTTLLYADLTRSSDPAAFTQSVALALLLVVMALLLLGPADVLLAPRLRSTRTATIEPSGGAGRAGAGWAATVVVAGYLVVAVGLPLAGLAATALTRAVGLSPTPANWTTENFTTALTGPNAAALGRSLGLAALAGALVVVLGASVAALEGGWTGRGAASLVMLTLVLPGSSLAVALLISYGRWIGGSVLIILLAYVAKLWGLAHRPISGAFDRVPPDEMRAARVSGAGPVTAVRTVLARALAPALLAGWLVCFLTALHEVTMSSLLYGPGSQTLAVVVLNSEELGQVGQTAALSVLLTGLVVVPAVLVWWLGRRAGVPGWSVHEH